MYQYEKKIERERILPNDPLYPRLFNEHLARYKLVIPYIKGKKVLDIGCGTGYGAYLLAQSGAAQVYGIDISEEAVEFCKVHYTALNLCFQRADAMSLPFENESYDVICGFEIIEHVKEPERLLSESKRVLKNGGIFICSTPNKSIVSPNSIILKNPYHIKEYCYKEFQSLFSAYFNRVEFFGQGAKYRYKIILRVMKLPPQWVQYNLEVFKRVTSNFFLIDGSIFTRIDIEHNSVCMLAICKKN